MAVWTPEADGFFRSVVHDLDDALFVVDRDRRVLYFNPRAEEVSGLSADQVVGQSCLQIVRCPSCGPSCSIFDAGAIRDEAGELLAADGQRVMVRKTAVVLHDNAGVVVGAIETFREHVPSTGAVARRRAEENEPLRAIVGRSAAIRKIVDTVRRLARTDVPVLITGESGTGKELVAKALHSLSRRKERPFVAVNCAALPAELVESELFGHVRGAFTGAVRDRSGAVELAEGGTFMLDEIGDLQLTLQAKLLRLLQDRSYQRVGDARTRYADIRVVSATHVDLDKGVSESRFRADLLYRLRVVPVHIPPLRERREDIVPLAVHLLARRSVSAGRDPMRFSPEALQMLERHAWPGNVRELVNVVDYVVALSSGETVGARDLPEQLSASRPCPTAPGVRARYAAPEQGDAHEAETIRRALMTHGYHRQRTADALGMDRVTLYRKMRALGLTGTGRG